MSVSRIATAGRSRAPSQLLAQRSVHLRIQPKPADLSESREILRVMQRFGEVSTFKNLRYEYHNPADNISLAIYRDADSAQQALNASPIRFALEKVIAEVEVDKKERDWSDDEIEGETETRERDALDGIEDIIRPSQLTSDTLLNTQASTSSSSTETSNPSSQGANTQANARTQRPTPLPFEPPAPIARKISSKWFQITVDRSRVIHQDFVERQPFWKQFTPMKSMAQEDLMTKVPHIGLSDVSKRPPNYHRTPNKVMKQMSWYVENRMVSLKEMFEEGEKR